MSEEEQAPAELEAPAIEQEAEAAEPVESPADEPVNLDAIEEGDEETEGEVAPEIELAEIEWEDGKKYQIPKVLEDGLLRNKDYTQKRQADAAFRKSLEAKEAEIELRSQVTDEELESKAELKSLDKRLSEYAKLTSEDWQFHAAQDPLGTENAWREYQILKEQRGEIAKNLETKLTERTAKAEQELATRVQETIQFAQKEIPGWKPELTDTLVKFALDNGVPEATIKANWSPTFYKLLHRAHIGEMALKRQSPIPSKPTQPLAKVTGAANLSASTNLADADMDSYVAMRKKGVGGKARG